ncbi:uncharacterized protein LOC119027773 isoform X2 [Acanthopagrus latus]|uniref:uncharacterized protein LOC119027773 isoform X2 n=1 Tax=Acanthopagrus latus TaxID=8177 RepID=UPI00187C58FF|nr:uncharacterized protein LOC119027773 isoform X2 [Acanthopagrus latus]
MTSLRLVFFHLTCLFLGIMAQAAALKLSSSVQPDGGLLSLKTGDNLTLTCFYNVDVAARLYWYKQPLGQKLQLITTFFYFDTNGTFYGEFKNNPRFTLESHPGLIYTHGGRNDQCERKDNTQTHTCVYNLPMKSLNLSHAGTYYCAVASCGHILFGNGTKLDFQDKVDSPVLLYFLSGALTFTTILVVLLTLSVFKMRKRNSYGSAGN